MFSPQEHLIQLPRKVKDRQTGQYVTHYDDYLEVKWRVLMFRERYPHGVISTEEITVDLDRGYARYKATVEDGEGGHATGYGTETQADFGDFCERAETRAVGRALALAGFGTQFVGQDLTEGEHIVDAPVIRAGTAQDNGAPSSIGKSVTGTYLNRTGERISRDQARDLKQTVQAAYGYAAGAQRLREDLGLDATKPLTLMRIVAHCPPERYQVLRAEYEAHLQAAVDADVP
jgi:hypothetical protein